MVANDGVHRLRVLIHRSPRRSLMHPVGKQSIQVQQLGLVSGTGHGPHGQQPIRAATRLSCQSSLGVRARYLILLTCFCVTGWLTIRANQSRNSCPSLKTQVHFSCSQVAKLTQASSHEQGCIRQLSTLTRRGHPPYPHGKEKKGFHLY